MTNEIAIIKIKRLILNIAKYALLIFSAFVALDAVAAVLGSVCTRAFGVRLSRLSIQRSTAFWA
ncbi:hypothetical protein H6B10_17300 [Gemmiger formicilis]|uniref:hypothetical protein n=1 Tax=Gemmiger formicilis TaxID=745368 RepID=UPI00195A46D7|nr:hypothetical protein [Gemmiger formicilis]MBM6901392.1 hypothetical protein [Gemmiger formicilis]